MRLTLKPDRRGCYFTPGTINGHPVTFLIDTGATVVGIPNTVAHRLDLKYTGKRNWVLDPFRRVKAPIAHIDEIAFGPFSFKHGSAMTYPISSGDETILIGMDLLKNINFVHGNGMMVMWLPDS